MSRPRFPFRLAQYRSTAALPALLTLAIVAAGATSAQAKPIPPVLNATTPESPGTLLHPRILGSDSGVGTSVAARAFRPIGTAAVDENATVNLYTDPACAGPVAVTGTLGELEGAGLEVAVAANSTTHFYGRIIDPAEPASPSDCSAPGLAYRHVSGPPPTPTVSGVEPASPADDNAPRIKGTAEADTTVAIYADAGCAGPALAAGSAELFESSGIPVPVADNSTTSFRATTSWAGLLSACSTTFVSFQEVTVAPPGGGGQQPPAGPSEGVSPSVTAQIPGRPAPPRLHTEPGGRADSTAPRIVGSAQGAVRVAIFATENCQGAAVVNGSVGELSAGIPVQVPANATTVFSAVAVAADGDRSRCTPEPVVYVEDSLPPLTKITFGPGVKTRKRSPVFRFSDLTGEPPGTTFFCKLDRREWQPCQSPWRLKRVSPKKHLVKVRAVDGAGNQESVGAKRRFKVVARQPR